MKNHIRRLVGLSLVCLFFIGIINANMAISSQVASQHDNEWIGSLSISLTFLGVGLGSLYNQYIGRYSYSLVIFLGAQGWNVFCSFSVIFLFFGFQDYVLVVIIVGSFVAGLLASAYYNGMFNYLNECGRRDEQSQRYFGINMCFNQSSNIVGNALSAVLIEPFGQKVYSLLMLALAFLLSLVFLGLPAFDRNSK